MVEKQQPIVIRTIAQHIEHCSALKVWCRNQDCRHSAPVDLFALGDRVGMDRDLFADRPRWKCSKCGGRAEVTVSSPHGDQSRREAEAERDHRRAQRTKGA